MKALSRDRCRYVEKKAGKGALDLIAEKPFGRGDAGGRGHDDADLQIEQHLLLQRNKTELALLDFLVKPDLGINAEAASGQDHVFGDMQCISEAVG